LDDQLGEQQVGNLLSQVAGGRAALLEDKQRRRIHRRLLVLLLLLFLVLIVREGGRPGKQEDGPRARGQHDRTPHRLISLSVESLFSGFSVNTSSTRANR